VKNGALHEDPTRLTGGMLIQRDDIRTSSRQECTDSRNQTGPVRAAQQ
jgi:hypothetical protein